MSTSSRADRRHRRALGHGRRDVAHALHRRERALDLARDLGLDLRRQRAGLVDLHRHDRNDDVRHVRDRHLDVRTITPATVSSRNSTMGGIGLRIAQLETLCAIALPLRGDGDDVAVLQERARPRHDRQAFERFLDDDVTGVRITTVTGLRATAFSGPTCQRYRPCASCCSAVPGTTQPPTLATVIAASAKTPTGAARAVEGDADVGRAARAVDRGRDQPHAARHRRRLAGERHPRPPSTA